MIYLFNHDETLLGELAKDEIKDPWQEETLNGVARLDFEVKISSINKMEGVEFVAHKDANEPDSFYMYKIVSHGNNKETVHYTAINIALDELSGYGYIREKRMESTTGALALDAILYQTRWSVALADNTVQKDFYLYDISRLEAISKLIDTFQVELQFKVEISGNRIVARKVYMYQEMGNDTGKRFYYKKNALEVIKEQDQTDIFTAIIPRGKGEEKFNLDGTATGGYGRRIDIKEVEWSRANGDLVDKPLGEEYIELKEATKKHGYSDGTARFKVVNFEQIDDINELARTAYNTLVNNSRPLVQFKAEIEKVGRLELGDKVRIIRKDLDIYYTARVFKIKRNLLDKEKTTVELGDNIDYKQAKKNKEVVNQLKTLNARMEEIKVNAQDGFVEVVGKMQDEIKNSYFNNDGYNYEFRIGNEYGLPAGYYSFNKPIEQSPSKVIYMGAGTMLIANSRDANGDWEWKTAATGDHVQAESVVGILGEYARVNANQINVNNDFSNTQLGKKVVEQDKLYNNIKITGNKGIQVLDRNNRERVQLGNWDTNRYGLKLTDPSGQNTVLDDQGILQTWQDSKCDNIDTGKPMKMYVYIPKETNKVFKALLRLQVGSFRAYSTGAASGGYSSNTSGGGGGQYVANTTTSGGAVYGTTHGIEDVVDSTVKRYVQNSSGFDYNQWIMDYNVSHHEHQVQIGSHSHDASFRLSDHYHGFTVDSHTHAQKYGIYEDSGTSTRMEIYINGTDRTYALTGSSFFEGTQTECDTTAYLKKGQYNTIEVRGRGRGRVDVTVFIQALIQFPGN